MAEITYRALDENNDPMWGQGQGNFIADLDAVSQAILTRLRLFEGEWWADLSDGLPLWQSILGVSANGRDTRAIDALIQARILATPFVTSISNVQSFFDPNSRSYKFYAQVQTEFGNISVSNQPTPPPQGFPQ